MAEERAPDPDDPGRWESYESPPPEAYEGWAAAPPPEDSPYEPVGYDEPYDDAPPPGVARPSRPRGRSSDDSRFGPPTVGAQDRVLATLRKVIAAEAGSPSEHMLALVDQIRTSHKVLAELDDDWKLTYEGVLEVLEVECVNLSAEAPIDLSDLPAAVNHNPAVLAELDRIEALARSDAKVTNATSEWHALVEHVQAEHTRKGLHKVLRAIDEKAPAERKLALFKAVEPPTTQASVIRERGVRTAREVVEAHEAALAGASRIRFSSGLRTLDYAFTKPGEPMGFIAPGEQSVIAGPTGTGKSSMSYGLVRSFAQDMVNWGLDDGLVIWFHTEEESVDKVRAAGLGPNQRWHHLADRVVVDAIGSSRTRMAEVLYDTVIDANHRAQRTGTDITRFLPHVVVVDYIQAIAERGEADNQAHALTAEMILRGIQAWNPEEIAKFSGLDFRTYAGMPWPEGMDNHRVAVVTFAQLKKPDDESLMFYKSNSRKHHLADFAFEDDSANPPWRAADGSGWSWEVRDGDMYLLKQNQIKGNSIILHNATTIVMLHRSLPRNNPKAPGLGADGRPHLVDARARLLLDKTRAGSELQFVPMEFDIQPDGFRAQYFDPLAETAIAQGRFTPHDSFRDSGDPILPIRPVASPFAGCRY